MQRIIVSKKEENKRKVMVQKVIKIKMSTSIPEEKKNQLIQEQQKLMEQLQTRYKVDYLDYKELRVLDCVIMNQNKRKLALELGCSTSLIYWITTKPEWVRALQEELKGLYDEMKDTRRTMYMKISEKGLNILMNRLDDIEQKDTSDDDTMSREKTRDILAIVDKIVMLMQEEDGYRKLGIDISGGLENANLNASATLKEFDIADKYFRKSMANFLVKSKGKQDITRVID